MFVKENQYFEKTFHIIVIKKNNYLKAPLSFRWHCCYFTLRDVKETMTNRKKTLFVYIKSGILTMYFISIYTFYKKNYCMKGIANIKYWCTVIHIFHHFSIFLRNYNFDFIFEVKKKMYKHNTDQFVYSKVYQSVGWKINKVKMQQ